MSHPYFGQMVYWGDKDHTKAYWEAELIAPVSRVKIGVTMCGNEQGPEPAEEAFCRELLADEGKLLQRCRASFLPRIEQMKPSRLAGNGPPEFILDGFSIPRHGARDGEWEAYYFCTEAKHYFTAHFSGGHVRAVTVDG